MFLEHILKVKSKVFADVWDTRCEGKRGVKDYTIVFI